MPTLEERVAALEAKVDAHAMSSSDVRSALTALRDQMDSRFEQVGHRFIELQDQMNRRFEQVDRRFEHMNHRFDQFQGQMNQRFDAGDQKIDRHFTWLVGIQVAALLAVVGALVGSYYR